MKNKKELRKRAHQDKKQPTVSTIECLRQVRLVFAGDMDDNDDSSGGGSGGGGGEDVDDDCGGAWWWW